MAEEITFQDADSYSYGFNEKISFKLIILNHLKKLTELASVEFRGGYYNIIITKEGAENQIYVPDSREIYINAVQVMADFLFPHFDKEMKKELERIEREQEELEKKFIDATSIAEHIVLSSNYYENDADKLLHEELKQKRLKSNKTLLRFLCCFLYRNKYLELGIIED